MVDFFCRPPTQIHHPWLSVFIILLNKRLNRGNRNIKFDFSLEERSKNKINVLEITCSIGKKFCKFVPTFDIFQFFFSIKVFSKLQLL